jgi:hypothetical protein
MTFRCLPRSREIRSCTTRFVTPGAKPAFKMAVPAAPRNRFFSRRSCQFSVTWSGSGCLFLLLVFRANTYGGATVEVAEGQTVISTGCHRSLRGGNASNAEI